MPLRARGRVLGALTLVTEEPYGRRYGQRDLHLAADLAGRAGLAVETLQRSLLPAVPTVEGLSVAARYLVSADEATVGGDWYDLLPLPDGAVGVAVGDVVGHDLRAAAAMGELRGVLRSYAWEGLTPGQVLDRCDRLVQGLDMAAMATAVYARLIGAVAAEGRASAVEFCPPGSLLLLYTDGLIDVPGLDAAERSELLRRTLADSAEGIDVEKLCDRVLDTLAAPQLRDDVALLAVRIETGD